jgi:chemotaxis signal transduction protein
MGGSFDLNSRGNEGDDFIAVSFTREQLFAFRDAINDFERLDWEQIKQAEKIYFNEMEQNRLSNPIVKVEPPTIFF